MPAANTSWSVAASVVFLDSWLYQLYIALLRVIHQEMFVRFHPSISIHFPLAWWNDEKKKTRSPLLSLCYDEYYSINDWKSTFFYFIYINGKYMYKRFQKDGSNFLSLYDIQNSSFLFHSFKKRIRQLQSLIMKLSRENFWEAGV